MTRHATKEPSHNSTGLRALPYPQTKTRMKKFNMQYRENKSCEIESRLHGDLASEWTVEKDK